MDRRDFNSYGSRRGNHEVMIRGTFANVRLKNRLVPGIEGGVTIHMNNGEDMSIYDAAMQYQSERTPLIIIAGKEYGRDPAETGPPRDTDLLGVRAVIAETFERIHRSNLVGMGILPLEFLPGQNAETLGLSGREHFDIEGLDSLYAGSTVNVIARDLSGSQKSFEARVRLDTPIDVEYYRNGGILQYVIRSLI